MADIENGEHELTTKLLDIVITKQSKFHNWQQPQKRQNLKCAPKLNLSSNDSETLANLIFHHGEHLYKVSAQSAAMSRPPFVEFGWNDQLGLAMSLDQLLKKWDNLKTK